MPQRVSPSTHNTRKEIDMKKNTNTMKLVEVGLNKYGQRLDEFNEFGQSLEAEAWYFDGAFELSVAPLPSLEALTRPAGDKVELTTHMNTRKTVELGLNKYGQRLDEFNEFGLSLEAEAWHFDTAVTAPVTPLPALECLVRPVPEKKQVGMSPAATHLQAA